jgi:hypothetical protein
MDFFQMNTQTRLMTKSLPANLAKACFDFIVNRFHVNPQVPVSSKLCLANLTVIRFDICVNTSSVAGKLLLLRELFLADGTLEVLLLQVNSIVMDLQAG